MMPQKSECPSGVGQVAEANANTANFATVGRNCKTAIANQIALLALAGHHVIRGDRGDFTVTKYGLIRYCANYAELAAFAKKLGLA